MSRPIDEILNEITVEEDLQQALTGEPGILQTMLVLIVAVEKGEWEQVSTLVAELQIDEQPLCEAYMDSVKWAHEIYSI